MKVGPQPPEDAVVRVAVTRFALLSALALLVLGAGVLIESRHIAHDEAIRDARTRGSGIATGVAAPLVNPRVRAGEPAALARLDETLRVRMREGSVTHLRLWAEDGTVIWSDEGGAVSPPLPEDVQALFGTDDDVTRLISGEGSADERGTSASSLEVYVGATDAGGQPLVLEAHVPPDVLEADRRAIIEELLPLTLGGLVIFQLAMLPLALSLARKVQRGQDERAGILRRAIAWSDLERRRIAHDLHDGVVQDLAGLRYAVRATSGTGTDDDSVLPGKRIDAILERDISSLRSLISDIYPPDLAGEGLVLALSELALDAEKSAPTDLGVTVEVPGGLQLSDEAARLTYRVVREGLRNVVHHAHAARASVSVRGEGDTVHVRVVDDGRGRPRDVSPAPGHMGLTLLGDMVRDAGGDLALDFPPSGGSCLAADFPAVLDG